MSAERARVTAGTTRQRTLGLLVAGLALAVATPLSLAVTSGLGAYLLHPAVFAAQACPFLLAGLLWLPRRNPTEILIGQWVARLLLIAAALLYLPMITGLMPMGGDMVALAFVAIDAFLVLVPVAATVILHGVLYFRRDGSRE